MRDSKAVDICRGSKEVCRQVFGIPEHIVGDVHGEGLGDHGVEREQVDGAVVGPIGRQGIRRCVRHERMRDGGIVTSVDRV